ncbi:Fe-S cluster assembly sulfur transfer protein SufU [Companilactobacillus sp.]|jgi:nitrogen fixation NifU-like protein|uniref:Fe-S cluster assembly sulfur transfer protein SufU n=1 Tax=Companilactobacillus sp. TaxID=2767905 RepID=UPI0025BC5285|nr:SUF system NifU family Fe-S cluster assembly protein [Companilactobacillus sp.]MCH4008381.1 SUF system NifU family Fe-S cluster assembly protein [Companilactobacillus sp.]MCH4051440.1 SUF system NifU family Fe-S cluster assembly protein [Companilactobacillus sp.]MCH4076324.1 SUF system NifU family Fe-S cluster assembly protein [Companilactobacillus sp.]MCH4124899.1 SUF system NifU family Fe-S cluster assembly protein [Companilactobacillus sp.]MCH4131441.1 SUF system NifU family Fe-S cluster
MALSKMDNLYRQVILDHSAHPHHHGELNDSTNEIELKNPTCGDVLQLDVKVDDGKITDIAFSGYGCTISQASASMMTDAVMNKDVETAENMVEDFSNMILGEDTDTDILDDAAVLKGVSQFPARIKCATLAWKALHKALNEK